MLKGARGWKSPKEDWETTGGSPREVLGIDLMFETAKAWRINTVVFVQTVSETQDI